MSEPHPPPQTTPGQSFQFSMRFILVLTGVAAVAFAVLFALPDLAAVLIMLSSLLLLPTIILVTVVYGHGYGRAFAVGASLPAFVVLMMVGTIFLQIGMMAGYSELDFSDAESATSLRWFVGVTWGVEFVCGLIGVLGRATSRKLVR